MKTEVIFESMKIYSSLTK